MEMPTAIASAVVPNAVASAHAVASAAVPNVVRPGVVAHVVAMPVQSGTPHAAVNMYKGPPVVAVG